MRLAIMQPYFFPYLGYFQLIAAVDCFVVYDNIKYTKKGWINRNRILLDGQDVMLSLPLKSGSDALDVVERELASDLKREKLLNQIRGAYRRAPYFEQTMPVIERIVAYEDVNLFNFLHHSLTRLCEHLDLRTKIMVSSAVAIDHALRNQEKVLAFCEALGAKTYVNAIGGMELYSKEAFNERGVALKFVRSHAFEYAQFGAPFVPWLSIIDVLMFNSLENVKSRIATGYELIES